jgi:hypothetical protein
MTLVRNVHTSRKSASRVRIASKVLRDPEASDASKSVAGSLLAEAKPAARKKAEKKAEEKAEAKPKKEAKPKAKKG